MPAFLLHLLIRAAVTLIGSAVLLARQVLTPLGNGGKHTTKASNLPSTAFTGCSRYPAVVKHLALVFSAPYISLLGPSDRVTFQIATQTLVVSNCSSADSFSRLTLYFPPVIDTLCSALYRMQACSYTELSARFGKLFTA